jgi:CheY-like chemotaxis protein
MPNRSRYQILLVDDDEGVRNTLAMLLTSAGYDVAAANDGFESLLHLKRALPNDAIAPRCTRGRHKAQQVHLARPTPENIPARETTGLRC